MPRKDPVGAKEYRDRPDIKLEEIQNFDAKVAFESWKKLGNKKQKAYWRRNKRRVYPK
jgi:hypothetical protein